MRCDGFDGPGPMRIFDGTVSGWKSAVGGEKSMTFDCMNRIGINATKRISIEYHTIYNH